MLERLLAGVLVIGLILWGASLLATPTDGAVEPPPPREPDAARKLPGADEPTGRGEPPHDDGEADEEDDDPPEREREPKGKGKGKRGRD